ncbi:IMP cyclohydrolase [Victivallis vadensis]|uniref:IMP cyclohydrolase n=1 Tax=Victivallis vadensis TaxID=172901 RepID=A0A2U1AVV0_9BACT|nr:IMP cyclohydrolase [Victivallis vadensis]NMD85712.1 IMP cyclohydrolase [Victivallis vadensis]PVY40367.1 IMP cyclohydrolase [Victivallis vadensis]HJH05407.1 IMP cyclohydrolase [Victivallis vadensis]
MYLGRIVAIGMTPQGKAAAMYRVSSRSFPNREAVLVNNQISILPRAGFESDLRKNPYISYNCVRLAGEWAVATNGSQTDPIVEKIAMGFPPRDAISLGLLAMDYEKDSLDTPRIVAAVSNKRPVGYLGIIRKDALLVREFTLVPGEIRYLSTYEKNRPCDDQVATGFAAPCVNCAAQYVVDGGIFAEFTNPVTSAAALASEDGFDLAVKVL